MTIGLVTPLLGVPALAVLGLLILSLVGIGPATRMANNIYLSPVVGLGIATAVLTTAAHLTPLGTAGPIILILVAAVSLLWTLRQWEPIAVSWSDAAGALAAVAGGLLLAISPALGQRSYGPVNLHFNDSWFYTSLDWFLQTNRIGDYIPSPTATPPLAIVNFVEAFHTRIGIDAWQATLAATVRLDPVLIQSAAQATTVATISLTAYGLARHFLDAPPWISILAAYFSLSPVTVQLFVDPRPANLAAIALAPVGLAYGARAVTSGTRSDAVIAGIAASGLIVTYTEHAPTFVFGAVVAWLFILLLSRNQAHLLRLTVTRSLLAIATAVVLSPLGVLRAIQYTEVLARGSSTGSPPQAGVSLSTLPILLAGTMHLHELDDVASLGTLATVGIYDVTFAVLGLVVLAATTTIGGHRRHLILPAVAILTVSGVLYAYFQVAGGCGDCVYKSITLSPVFLAVALAAAVQLLWTAKDGSTIKRLLVATLVVAYGGLLLRGQAVLVRGADRVEAATASGSYAISGALEKLPDGPVLAEGATSTSDFEPFFHGPEILYLAGRSSNHPLRYESTTRDLVSGFGLPNQPFAADYRYVITGFPGLESDRRKIRSFGEYALEMRSSGDVAVLRSNGTRDPDYRGVAAIPWLRGSITLRVSGISAGARLILRFTGAVVPNTSFAIAGLPVEQRLSRRPGNKIVCVALPPSRRPTDVTIVPGEYSSPPISRDEVDGPAPVPKGVGLAAWSLREAGSDCTD